jgi:hypothetical protein
VTGTGSVLALVEDLVGHHPDVTAFTAQPHLLQGPHPAAAASHE